MELLQNYVEKKSTFLFSGHPCLNIKYQDAFKEKLIIICRENFFLQKETTVSAGRNVGRKDRVLTSDDKIHLHTVG